MLMQNRIKLVITDVPVEKALDIFVKKSGFSSLEDEPFIYSKY